MRKTFLILLSIALLITCLSGCDTEDTASESASSEDDISQLVEMPAEEFEYEINDTQNVVIYGYKGSNSDIVIPTKINGKAVVEIGDNAFALNSKLVSVTLPEGLKTIKKEAFKECTALTNINLPMTLEFLGERAFEGCINLENITIPGSIKTIEPGPFAFSGLKSVEFGEGVQCITAALFHSTSIIDITLPSSIKEIRQSAFSQCTNLKSVTLNDGLETIEQYAFSGTSIEEIIIPSSVTVVSDSAFHNNYNLKKVIFQGNAPSNFLHIDGSLAPRLCDFTIYYNEGAQGFTSPRWQGYPCLMVGCEKNELVFDDFVYHITEDGIVIDDYLGDNIEITIPSNINGKNVIEIGIYAFSGNDNLESVFVPGTIVTINERAFAFCDSLKEVVLSEGLENIGSYAFYLTAVEQITIPQSVTYISENAFEN